MLLGWLKYSTRSNRRFFRLLLGLVFCVIALNGLKHLAQPARKISRIQHDFGQNASVLLEDTDRLQAVRDEFMHAWTGYKEYGWLSDSLGSVTGVPHEQFCGWAATLIDSLDTLYIMGLVDEFEEAVNATTTIDFNVSTTRCQVNIFESTIRYLGGMLAAFDLSQDQRLLTKMVELGNILHSGFGSTNGMPCSHCNFSRHTVENLIVPDQNVPLADMGSFYLEFARLSQVTGDQKYLDTVGFLTNTFEDAQNKSSLPGLWPERLDASSINGPEAAFVSTNHVYSLGALSDSAYEYLVKAHLLLGGQTDQYSNMWRLASQEIKNLFLFRAYIPQWKEVDVLFSGIVTKSRHDDTITLEPRTQHLGCFAGGLFALSSRIFNEPEDLRIGEALTNGCVWAYDNSPLGIMPETFTLLNCPNRDGRQCAWDPAIWNVARHTPRYCNRGKCSLTENYPPGYLMSIDPSYSLRPEAIESVFVMYRITGDPKWRDIGWKMFTSIIEHTRTPYGHASLETTMELRMQSVVVDDGEVLMPLSIQRDEMESYWLAETLKYFYLLFSDPELISLDDYVLNTEAHPLKLTKDTRAFW